MALKVPLGACSTPSAVAMQAYQVSQAVDGGDAYDCFAIITSHWRGGEGKSNTDAPATPPQWHCPPSFCMKMDNQLSGQFCVGRLLSKRLAYAPAPGKNRRKVGNSGLSLSLFLVLLSFNIKLSAQSCSVLRCTSYCSVTRSPPPLPRAALLHRSGDQPQHHGRAATNTSLPIPLETHVLLVPVGCCCR
jgi:hypothetical protein